MFLLAWKLPAWNRHHFFFFLQKSLCCSDKRIASPPHLRNLRSGGEGAKIGLQHPRQTRFLLFFILDILRNNNRGAVVLLSIVWPL